MPPLTASRSPHGQREAPAGGRFEWRGDGGGAAVPGGPRAERAPAPVGIGVIPGVEWAPAPVEIRVVPWAVQAPAPVRIGAVPGAVQAPAPMRIGGLRCSAEGDLAPLVVLRLRL